MTIAQWYERFGDELIGAEGYGVASFIKGNTGFLVIFSEERMERRPGHDAEQGMFSGDQPVMDAVNYFLDQVAIEERPRILAAWKERGLEG